MTRTSRTIGFLAIAALTLGPLGCEPEDGTGGNDDNPDLPCPDGYSCSYCFSGEGTLFNADAPAGTGTVEYDIEGQLTLAWDVDDTLTQASYWVIDANVDCDPVTTQGGCSIVSCSTNQSSLVASTWNSSTLDLTAEGSTGQTLCTDPEFGGPWRSLDYDVSVADSEATGSILAEADGGSSAEISFVNAFYVEMGSCPWLE